MKTPKAFFLLVLCLTFISCNELYFTSPQPINGFTEVKEIPQFLEGTFILFDEPSMGDTTEKKIALRTEKHAELYIQDEFRAYDLIPIAKLNLNKNMLISIPDEFSSDGDNSIVLRKLSGNQYCLNILVNKEEEKWAALVFKPVNDDLTGDIELLRPEYSSDVYKNDSMYYKSTVSHIQHSPEGFFGGEMLIETDAEEFLALIKGNLIKKSILIRK